MVLDPTNAWVVTHNGKIGHIRPTKALAEACATMEKEWCPTAEVKIVPVLMTEIEDVSRPQVRPVVAYDEDVK